MSEPQPRKTSEKRIVNELEEEDETDQGADDESQLLGMVSLETDTGGSKRGGGNKAKLWEEHLADETKTGSFRVFTNALISFMGAGILNLPYAFKQIGVLAGTVVIFVVGLLCLHAMLLLIKCKYGIYERWGKTVYAYGDIATILLGPLGRTIVDICIAVSQVGFCIAYLLFIANSCEDVFGWHRTFTIWLCVPSLLVLSLIRDLKLLAAASFSALVSNLLGQAVVYYAALAIIMTTGISESVEIGWTHTALPYFIGVAVYCYEGVAMVLLIEESARDKAKFPALLSLVMLAYTILCCAFGAVGYYPYIDPCTPRTPCTPCTPCTP
jgi:proton-coupled amino acid transporter